MNIVKRIILNSGYVIAGRVLNIFLRLIPVILMIRYLGSELYGIYSFVLAFVGIFAVFVDMGIDKILIREVSKNKEKMEEYIGSVLILKMLMSFMVIFVIISMSLMLNLTEMKFVGVAIVSLFLLFQSMRAPLSTYFRVNLKMQYSVLATLTGSAVFIILILWFIQIKAPIYYFFVAYILSYFTSTLCIYLFSRKFHRINFVIDTEIWKHFLKISLPLGIVLLFITLNDRIGILILNWLKGDKAVGYFSAPLAIMDKLTIIPFASMMSLFPVFSKLYEDKEAAWKRGFEISFKYMFIISVFLAALSTRYSDEIVLLLFGSDFAPSVKVFPILMWSIVFIFINFVLIDVITSAGRQKILIPIFALTFVVTLILNLIFVPKYSFVGTAISFLISKSIISIMCTYYLFSKFSLCPKVSVLVRIVASSALMLIILNIVRIPFWLAVPLALAVYLFLLFSLKILDTYDIDLLKKVY